MRALLDRVFGVLDEPSQERVLESLTAALAVEALPGAQPVACYPGGFVLSVTQQIVPKNLE